MQDAVTNAAQTQQWSFILSQLFAWVMAGLAWIVPFLCYLWAVAEAPASSGDTESVPARGAPVFAATE